MDTLVWVMRTNAGGDDGGENDDGKRAGQCPRKRAINMMARGNKHRAHQPLSEKGGDRNTYESHGSLVESRGRRSYSVDTLALCIARGHVRSFHIGRLVGWFGWWIHVCRMGRKRDESTPPEQHRTALLSRMRRRMRMRAPSSRSCRRRGEAAAAPEPGQRPLGEPCVAAHADALASQPWPPSLRAPPRCGAETGRDKCGKKGCWKQSAGWAIRRQRAQDPDSGSGQQNIMGVRAQ